MRLREIYEDGRIVKGVNTTVDVGPDEIKTQATKFGNTVDRDGRPPTLSKKVKGKSTNVLFNLGLAESYTRDQLPQIKNKQLSKIKHTLETVKLTNLIPVQEERIVENFKSQVDNIVAGNYKPIIVDSKNRIVNGHHRYTALEMLGYESVEVARLPWTLEQILENFAEGYKLQLERDKEMLVLNITDTSTGKRTEVRGKSGYETDYDPNDKLHMLLDKVGKSANIAELINGEVVTINPKHPDAKKAKSATDKAFSEKWTKKYKDSINCSNPKGFSQKAHCAGRKKSEDQHPNDKPLGPETKPTMPAGTIRVKVSDVYDWYKLGQHISDLANLDPEDFGKGPPEAVISFGSEEEEHEYVKLLQKLGLEILDVDPGAADAPGVDTDSTYNTENFADGKVKGKSRPGRVKKSGASCNGSVTALRKRAKNSSGEKAKMYHWCANMKAGKKN